MAQAANYKKIQKIRKNYKYKCRTLKNRESMLAMWMSTRIKIPNVPKKSISLFPLKMPSLKNPDPGSLCKKWGVRVSHVEKPPVLAKKLFCDNPGCPIL